MEQSQISWHPAFVQAIQMELKDYRDILEFYPEYQLTAEPLRIDCVVIKKPKDIVIKKNIAAIFRGVNLLEYKSPDDYVSVADFYKVYGYACLYASLEKASITDLTITFVESHYPRELLGHLSAARGYKVEETVPGVYTAYGDILPIQIIDSRKLSADENLWLRGLSNRLEPVTIIQISNEVVRYGKTNRIQAYLNVIVQANYKTIEETMNMSDSNLAVEKFLEVGRRFAKIEAQLEARGEERKAQKIAKNMVNLGFSIDDIVSATMLDREKVKAMFQEAGKNIDKE